MMKWLDQLERKTRRFAIVHLMNYIVFGMALTFIADFMGLGFSRMLSLNMAAVARGQIWRLVTFVFLPPNTSLLWILFSLYFYWMIGSALENQWGSARFTLFYLTGMIGNILAALLTGYADNMYLNLSLFFAFAALWPDFEIMVFFILPVKMKWLALLNAALFVWQLIVGTWSTRAVIFFSLLNVALFLGGDLFNRIKQDSHYWKTRYNFRKSMKK
ncbi:MAG: rhomboid family intramembrane serine protease [Eubacteriales bacterium]|nr:rhomboid family intramembrane serine protease [Eubacteriales bacterium]